MHFPHMNAYVLYCYVDGTKVQTVIPCRRYNRIDRELILLGFDSYHSSFKQRAIAQFIIVSTRCGHSPPDWPYHLGPPTQIKIIRSAEWPSISDYDRIE